MDKIRYLITGRKCTRKHNLSDALKTLGLIISDDIQHSDILSVDGFIVTPDELINIASEYPEYSFYAVMMKSDEEDRQMILKRKNISDDEKLMFDDFDTLVEENALPDNIISFTTHTNGFDDTDDIINLANMLAHTKNLRAQIIKIFHDEPENDILKWNISDNTATPVANESCRIKLPVLADMMIADEELFSAFMKSMLINNKITISHKDTEEYDHERIFT